VRLLLIDVNTCFSVSEKLKRLEAALSCVKAKNLVNPIILKNTCRLTQPFLLQHRHWRWSVSRGQPSTVCSTILPNTSSTRVSKKKLGENFENPAAWGPAYVRIRQDTSGYVSIRQRCCRLRTLLFFFLIPSRVPRHSTASVFVQIILSSKWTGVSRRRSHQKS
jgi:hypothetical protein